MADELKYPHLGIFFNVKFNIPGSGVTECSFQEVSGLEVKIEPAVFKEGGENRYVHRLPTPPKYSNLVLKNGLFDKYLNPVISWATDSIFSMQFKPLTEFVVNLVDAYQLAEAPGIPTAPPRTVASWKIVNAYPITIKVSEFNAEKGQVAIETLELAYDYFERTI